MQHPIVTLMEQLLPFGCKGGLGADSKRCRHSGEVGLDGHGVEHP